MKRYFLTSLFVSMTLTAVVFVSSTFVSAQQPEPAANTAVPDEKDMPDFSELGPKNKEFSDSLQPYGKILSEMQQLTVAYQTATPEQKDEIMKKFDSLLPQANEYRRKMVGAGVEAFRETPFKNPFVVSFLVQLLEYENASDNYEVSFKIADVFMQNLDKAPADAFTGEFYAAAADAAFGVMEFDKAEAWFKMAREKNAELSDELRQHLAELPKLKTLWVTEQQIRAKEAAADDLPRVLLRTSKGDITIELFENEAPNSVANFISLVKHGFYTNVPFHRVLPHFMAQGGDPTGTGSGGPKYAIDCECYETPGKPLPRTHFRGSISMANAGKNTNGSQFFLMFVPVNFLNGRHTVFGRIVDGIDVLADLQRIDPSSEGEKPTPDMLIEAKVIRDRGHEYVPVKNKNRG